MKIGFIGDLPAASVLPEEYIRQCKRTGNHPAPWMVALLPELAKITGHQLRVFLPQRAVLKPVVVERDGVEYEGIPCRIPERLLRKALYYQKSMALSGAVRRYSPDLLHAFGFETGSALIALRMGRPVSCFIQGIAEYYLPYYGQRDIVERQVGVWGERKAVPQVRWMVAENEFAKKWALSRNPEAEVDIIPHPTREVFFEKAAPVYEKRIITVGGLDDRKGMDTVIRAFAAINETAARLDVVGAGPLRKDLEALARELGIAERVEFTGGIGTDQVIARMNAARAFVIGSRMDTSPNVVSEAHAIGLPVIGTTVGGIPEMIDEGKDGFLVERDDVTAMAERMTRLMQDRDLAQALGEAGREKVRGMNDAADVAEAHAQFFSRIGKQLGVAGM
jgi:glycosyltransferase involved in cell wall biosynthesis